MHEAVKNIVDIYHENKLAHAYLFATNNLSLCYNDTLKLIKNILCHASYSENCAKCNQCHQINENLFPNVYVISTEENTIKKEQIDTLKQVFSTIPIFAKMNIYIIMEPEKMNATAYNKLLKFLEEPADNIIGFFISKNKDDIADTIISRCEVIKVNYNLDNKTEDSKEKYSLITNIVNNYLNILELRNEDIIWYNNNVILKELSDRKDIIIFMQILLNNLKNSFNTNYLSRDLTKLKIVNKYLNQATYNVNLALILDSLAIEMEQVYE